MSSHSFRGKSRKMALCGVLSALAVVLLSLGGILPFATFCCPLLAILCLVPVVEVYGGRTALLFYTAVSLLSILLAPDKEVALLFVFLGYYPAIRPRLNRMIHHRLLRVLCKLVVFACGISVMYFVAIQLLGMTYIVEEYTSMQGLLAATAAMGCLLWLVFDRVLERFTLVFRHKWRKKIGKV